MKTSRRIPGGPAAAFAAILFVLFLISAAQRGAGNGATDSPGGIFSLQREFRTNSLAVLHPEDIYCPGFTNYDVTPMQFDSSVLGTTPFFENITATQGTNCVNCSDATYSGLLAYSGDLVSQLGGAIAGDLMLSHPLDLKGNADINSDAIVSVPGLQPYGLDRRTPIGGGLAGNVAANTGASPGMTGPNDKSDLQNGLSEGTVNDVTAVPEPSTLLLVCVGLAFGLLRKRARN